MPWTVKGTTAHFGVTFDCADAAAALGAVRFLAKGGYGTITIADPDGRAVTTDALTALGGGRRATVAASSPPTPA